MKIAVLGAGKMASALVRGWVAAGAIAGSDVAVANRTAMRGEAFATEMGGVYFPAIADAVNGADIALVSVKPFAVTETLLAAGKALSPDCLVLSVAAGIRLRTMEETLPEGIAVIRTMPNTPALVGAGATAFCRGASATEEHATLVRQLFSAVGIVVEVTEDQIDAVIGVSGSGVAYLYLIIEALTDGGVRAGLPRDASRLLAAQTALGAARMVLETGEHPAALKDAVTTPGGTTISALEVLEKAGLRGTLIEAVIAARDRARELA